MAPHGLASITLGVPNVEEETTQYYEEFGLDETRTSVLASTDGGEHLTLSTAKAETGGDGRAVQDEDDLGGIAKNLTALGRDITRSETDMSTVDPVTGVRAVARIAPPPRARTEARAGLQQPGRGRPVLTAHARLPRFGRTGCARGASVTSSSGPPTTQPTFGRMKRLRLPHQRLHPRSRCLHALLRRPPQPFGPPGPRALHAPLEPAGGRCRRGRPRRDGDARGDPERQVWGLGRHYARSNFFYYLKDPAGNFSEYCSNMDCA